MPDWKFDTVEGCQVWACPARDWFTLNPDSDNYAFNVRELARKLKMRVGAETDDSYHDDVVAVISVGISSGTLDLPDWY